MRTEFRRTNKKAKQIHVADTERGKKHVSMSWFVLVSSVIGVENGFSDNHEAYYCITKVITLSITMRTVIQMNLLELEVTARS